MNDPPIPGPIVNVSLDRTSLYFEWVEFQDPHATGEADVISHYDWSLTVEHAGEEDR